MRKRAPAGLLGFCSFMRSIRHSSRGRVAAGNASERLRASAQPKAGRPTRSFKVEGQQAGEPGPGTVVRPPGPGARAGPGTRRNGVPVTRRHRHFKAYGIDLPHDVTAFKFAVGGWGQSLCPLKIPSLSWLFYSARRSRNLNASSSVPPPGQRHDGWADQTRCVGCDGLALERQVSRRLKAAAAGP